MTNSTALLTVGMVVCAGLLIVGGIVFVVWSSRRRKRQSAEQARQLGFQLLTNPDADLVGRVERALRPATAVRLSNVARKVVGDVWVYLFDVSYRGGGRSDSLQQEYCCVAVISPRAALAPFLLVPRLPQLGPLGDSLNDLYRIGAKMAGMREVSGGPLGFADRYLLFSGDAAPGEVGISDRTLVLLGQAQKYVARGCGDLLVFNDADIRRGATVTREILAEHVRKALQLAEWLQE